MKDKIDKNILPSEEFMDAIINSVRHHALTCENCGREHYSIEEPGNYEEGELEQLKENHKNNPSQYIEHDAGIHWGYFLGKQVVDGCVCNYSLREYEELIWGNRQVISRYFEKMSEKILKRSNDAKELASAVKKSIDKIASSD